jgi:hypothetical protein
MSDDLKPTEDQPSDRTPQDSPEPGEPTPRATPPFSPRSSASERARAKQPPRPKPAMTRLGNALPHAVSPGGAPPAHLYPLSRVPGQRRPGMDRRFQGHPAAVLLLCRGSASPPPGRERSAGVDEPFAAPASLAVWTCLPSPILRGSASRTTPSTPIGRIWKRSASPPSPNTCTGPSPFSSSGIAGAGCSCGARTATARPAS